MVRARRPGVRHSFLQSSGVGWPSGLSHLPIRALRAPGAPLLVPGAWSPSWTTRPGSLLCRLPAGASSPHPGCSPGFRFLTAAACTDLAASPSLQTQAVEKETLEGPGTRTGKQEEKVGWACGHGGVYMKDTWERKAEGPPTGPLGSPVKAPSGSCPGSRRSWCKRRCWVLFLVRLLTGATPGWISRERRTRQREMRREDGA